jgi:hypothetical protein
MRVIAAREFADPRLNLNCASNDACTFTSGQDVLALYGFPTDSGDDLLIVLGLLLAYRFLAYSCLLVRVRSRK